MQRRRHSAEFKNEAVKLLLVDGLSVNEVSEKLGVSTGSLYAWKAKHLDYMEAQAPEGAQNPKALAAARSNAFEYIEVFHNCLRKHSSSGYKSPLEFEKKLRTLWGYGHKPAGLHQP